MNRRAFTLIELLVVIAIIAILAAILFPVFAQAKASAKKASNLSAMKQLALSGRLYSSDYDDTSVLAWGFTDANGIGTQWSSRLFPYVKNDGIYVDPTGPIVNPTKMKEGPYYNGNGSLNNNATYYCSRPNAALNWHLGWGVSESAAERPSDLITVFPTGVNNWFGDGSLIGAAATTNPWHHSDVGGGYPDWASNRCQQKYDAYDNYIASRGQSAWGINWRYSNGGNFSFSDGHGKYLKQGTMKPENFYLGAPPSYASENASTCSN